MTIRGGIRVLLVAVLVFAPLARGGVRDWAAATIQMAMLAAAGLYALDAIRQWRWTWKRTPLDAPALVLFGLVAVSALFSEYRPATWRALGLLAVHWTFYGLASQVFDSRARRRALVRTIFGLAFLLSLVGFVKLSGPEMVPWWVYDDIGLHAGRLSGSYGNPNHLAGFLVMTLPMMLAWGPACRSAGERFLLRVLIAVCGTALILTLSRGGWAGFSAGMAWMLAARARRRKDGGRQRVPIPTALAAVGLILLVVLSSTPATLRVDSLGHGREEMSFAARRAAWKGVAAMISDAPLTGTGPGTFSRVFSRYQPPGLGARFVHAHNDPLEFAAELGLWFFPWLGWFAWRFSRETWRNATRRSRTRRALALGGGAAFWALLVHGLVDFNLQIPANALLAAALGALAVGAETSEGETPERD